MRTITPDKWKWFGNAGHFICARDCRFHLCTKIGKYLVSTVGQYFPDEPVREIEASSRGITLEGKGDARRFDYMQKVGYTEIGYNRLFETMVFKFDGICREKGCECGLPTIIPTELDYGSYNETDAATKGHLRLCKKWARKQP